MKNELTLADVELDGVDYSDEASIAAALRKAAIVSGFAETYKLYVIARALQVMSWDRVREIVFEAMNISLVHADRYIMIASKVGVEKLREALEASIQGRAGILTIEQWQGLAAVQDSAKRNELIDQAMAHGLPAFEIRAHAEELSPQEYHKVRALKTLERALQMVTRFEIDHDLVMEILAKYGFAPKVIRNVR